jgi:hypothetical protein
MKLSAVDDWEPPPTPLSLTTIALLIAAAVSAGAPLTWRRTKSSATLLPSEPARSSFVTERETTDAAARDKSPATLIQIGKNIFVRIGKDNLSLVSAGVAFYGMTAIFPAIAAFVSTYGLFSDPIKVRDEVAGLSSLLPAASLKLLTDALQT